MLLSKLCFSKQLEIYNEKDFETLALVVQNPQMKFITFVNDQKYLSKLNENVSMVITKSEIKDNIPSTCGIVISDNPTLTFFTLHNFLENNKNYVRPKYKTKIGKNCTIGKFASIAENNVTIGDNVVIEDFVTIYPNTTINDNVIIRSGARIGAQGFEYKRCPNKTILTVNHYGGVVIEHDVDIHCNVCVDRAVYTWDNTIIGEYSKVEGLSYIGHGVKIGARCLIAAGSIFGGRTVVGEDCWFGIGTIVKNAIKIGNTASVTMGAVLANNVKDAAEVSGFYAINHNDFLMNQFKLRNLK